MVLDAEAVIDRRRLKRRVTAWRIAAVMLALAPLTLAVFGGMSLVGLAVNLIAIPVVSFVFVPLVLAGGLAALLAAGRRGGGAFGIRGDEQAAHHQAQGGFPRRTRRSLAHLRRPGDDSLAE